MKLAEYKDKLIDILREDVFCELMNFWRNVEESEFDFKIFVSKKCYVLYKVFIPLFDFSSYNPCVKITDTAIPLYKKEMDGKKVLIIDDVFIHGRTSLKIGKEISTTASDMKFYVFAKNSNQGQYQDISTQKFNNILKAFLELHLEKNHDIEKIDFDSCFDIEARNKSEKRKESSLAEQQKSVQGHINCNKEYQWKKISDLVMKCIWGVNMPYVSYLPIFTVKNAKEDAFSKLACENQGLNTHRQERLEQHFTYYIKSSKEASAIIHYCFIVTQNDFIGDCKITPMVFFDCENTSISKEFINSSLKIICGNKTEELMKIFPQKTKSSTSLIAMLQYLIFNVSYLAGMIFLKKNGFEKENYDIDFTNAQYSFGDKLKEYLNILKNITMEENLLSQIEQCTIRNNKHTNKEGRFIQQEALLKGLEEAFESTQKCKMERSCPRIVDTLSKYFKFNNMYDEENIYKLKKDNYIRGLSFSKIKEFLLNKGYSIDDVISGLMYQYNLGAATIDFLYDYDEQDHIIDINMYWRSGEQSYKCISNTYVLPVYYQNLYERTFERNIADFLCELFVEFTKSNYELRNVPFDEEDFEKYCGAKDDVYDTFDIDEYCEDYDFKYLGYLGKQMEQYILFGHIEEVLEKDKEKFKENFYKFLERRTKKEILDYCKKILWDER